MKVFRELLFIFVVLHYSNGDSIVRRKRFFNNLWPSEIKSDVQDGLIYSQLPPQYLHLLPGVNDHLQRRAGVQQPASGLQPPRFVHPTRMAASIPRPQQQQQQQRNTQQQATILKQIPTNTQAPQPVQNGPKIVMKPVGQTSKQSPSITLKTKEQPLPDIHKTQRFITQRPLPTAPQRQQNQPFNTYQQLPIKKVFEALPQLSVKTSPINEFYSTREFHDLLKRFNLNVDITKLPPISDVMGLLNTKNGEETIEAIQNIIESEEGKSLIQSFLDQNADPDQNDADLYNYDEDVGAGEIQVGGSEGSQGFIHKPNIQYAVPQSHFLIPPQVMNVPTSMIDPRVVAPVRATTTGTLTGENKVSWWRPTTWFSSAQSTNVESLQKDAEILKRVVPHPGSVGQNFNYISNFLTPVSRGGVAINPSPDTQQLQRRTFFAQPSVPLQFTHSSVIDNTRYLHPVRMTEEQYQEVMRRMNQHQPVAKNLNTRRVVVSTQVPPVFPSQAPQVLPTQATTQLASVGPSKFAAPINVQSINTGLTQQSVPLPSTYTQFDNQQPEPRAPQSNLELPRDNRRNFVSATDPQRSAPYDFVATGRVHKADPEEVLKKSRSLAEIIEGEEILDSLEFLMKMLRNRPNTT